MNQQSHHTRRERVLVVDDAREIREFLTEHILTPRGFEVLTAADGIEGLQLAFSEKPDLMIVDVQMPNMSGLDLLRRLRLRKVNIPAILITAHGSEQVAVMALRLGVRDYVIKPFVVEEMEAAIDRALRESRLAEEREQLIRQLQTSNDRLRQRAQELNALYSIGKSVSSSLELDAILQRVVDAAVYLSSADQGSLLLLGEDGHLYIRASKGSDSPARSLHERVEDVEAGRVMHSKNTAILTGERYPTHAATAPRVHALAYIPLINRGRAIGVLTVGNLHQEREFTKRETRVLSALASYAASAIGNARLHERIAAERNQLHTIINQSDNPILVINHQHRLVVANQAARKLLGLPTGRIGGDPLGDLLRDRQLLEFITQKPDTGLVRHAHVQLSDGKTYRATLTPIKDVGRSVVMHRLGES